MKTSRTILLSLLTFLLASCESYYWPLDHTGGFSEHQVSPKEWVVEMHVPTGKKWEYAENLCLLRCAELCIDNGDTHFELVDSHYDKENLKGWRSTLYTVAPSSEGSRPWLKQSSSNVQSTRSVKTVSVVARFFSLEENQQAPLHAYHAQATFSGVIRRHKLDQWDPIKYRGHLGED